MNVYQEEIKKRCIRSLVHFTKSSNLPFILGVEKLKQYPNGILSDDILQVANPDFIPNDKHRYDQCKNYVCCSVQFPNLKFQYHEEITQKDNLFDEWAFILIDPLKVINDTTLFSPVNAAIGKGINIGSGINAFCNLFADEICYKKNNKLKYIERPQNLPSCYASDIQAEVLIKNKIPIDAITEIDFPSNTFKYEKMRLEFCDVNLGKIKLQAFSPSKLWNKKRKLWPKD